jgi:hypothetical protein
MADEVAADVAETVAPDSVENDDAVPASTLDEKLDRIITILESSVAATSPESGSGATEPAAGDVTEPANGQTIRDESPASLPWTHRRPFHG